MIPVRAIEPDGRCFTGCGCDTHWYALWCDPSGLRRQHTTGASYRKKAGAAAPHAAWAVDAPLRFPIEHILRKRGLNPFIPVESKFVRHNAFHAGRRIRVRVPILPGLVFLHLQEPVNWYWLLSIPMVSRPFMAAGAPVRFPQAAVDELDAISEFKRAPDYAEAMPTNAAYDPGDEVIVREGPFSDLRVRVLAVDIMRKRSRVLAEFLGQMRELEMDTSNLAAVERKAR